MTKSNILFIGMDVHKESIEIAIADDGPQGEVRRYGRIGGTLDALKKTVRKLESTGKSLHLSRVNYFVRFGDNYDGRLSGL